MVREALIEVESLKAEHEYANKVCSRSDWHGGTTHVTDSLEVSLVHKN